MKLLATFRLEKVAIDPLTMLAIGGASIGTGLVGAGFGRLAMKGTGSPKDPAPEKGMRTRLSNRLLAYFRQGGSEPTLERERDFPATAAHADPRTDTARASYFSHPSIIAHELGHLSNEAQGRKSLLGRMLRKATDVAYSPMNFILPIGAAAAYGLGHDLPGDIALGGTASLSGLQLLEEGRASRKALKAMKAIKGKTRAEDVLPLAGGFGTYLLGGLGAVGIPLMAREML